MNFPTLINLATILLCSGVLVQCWRMIRALERFRAADFPQTVAALQAATAQAEAVLQRMRATLSSEAEPKLRAIADATRVADELGVMIGIADASADRLLDVARQARSSAGELAA